MGNIAETVKKQTDRILRQRQLNGTEGVTITGIESGGGTPSVNSPTADLTAHKTSADHDGRYYTEGEIDGKLNFLTMTDTPAAYTGEGGKIVAVKSDVTGLEFVAAPPAENGVPPGGTTNQLAAKNSNDDYDIKWMDAPEAANGLPAEGTTGQVLEKIDGTDYNVQWVDVNAVKIKTKPVNIPGFAGKDGYILAYDETADEFYLKADEGGGGESTFTFFARSNKAFFAWDDFGFTTINEPV